MTASCAPEQLLLPLTFRLPNGLCAIPQVAEQVLPPRTGAASVAPWAARLAQAVLEVVAAERPVGQLSTWVQPKIYQRLHRRQLLCERQTGHQARFRRPEQVRSVHVCHPSPDVAEVSVVTSGGERCRALALRLEHLRGRWLCTELDWV